MTGSDPFGALNVAEIEGLNQRGGRTLSFCDLIEAGTMCAEMAGELAAVVESGASILTAAGPSGAGKSTVLANILACLPPGERIVTTPDVRAVENARSKPPAEATCFLAHEIGSGPWYAYLWGEAAARFFALPVTGQRIASCLHADTIDELYALLDSQGVSASDMRAIGVVAFVVRVGGKRRVGSVYVPGESGDSTGLLRRSSPGCEGRELAEVHRLRWRWDEPTDTFEPVGGPADLPLDRPERAGELAQAVERLVEERVRGFAQQRRRLAEVLGPRRPSTGSGPHPTRRNRR